MNHSSAKPSHYNKEADCYDEFNEKNSEQINGLIEKILCQNNVKTVLDLTCGTGSQVFWLSKRGFHVVGADINSKMLSIAKDKAKKEKLSLKFIKGDMRSLKITEFDAVLTIFNSIGHLTKLDFENAIRNIHSNLKKGGLYIFDIFNLDYLLEGKNISNLTIDWIKTVDNKKVREIQYSTISKEGVLASYDIYIEQNENEKPKTSKHSQTIQVYSSSELKELLQRNGFNVMTQCNIDGSELIVNKSERIVTVAQKI